VGCPTLSGGARLKIPPGTDSGQIFRLKGRGMPSLRGGSPGDLLVTVTLVTPPVVDERSKELLREFERLNPENPRAYTESKKG
jgi:DnaJ-class molecular chaperone